MPVLANLGMRSETTEVRRDQLPRLDATPRGASEKAEDSSARRKTGVAGAASASRSAARAADLLACFSLDSPRHRVADLARLLGLHPSTVYRYLEALEEASLVERDDEAGVYRLGLRVVELSAVALREIAVRRVALDEMDALRDEVGCLVNLGLLLDADVVHVAHAFPEGWPRAEMDVGRSAAAQCTALGKSLLASLPWEAVISRIRRQGWRPCTENSIQDEVHLKTELELVRQRGYAVDLEERHKGIVCVGVPVRGGEGRVVAALSVTAWRRDMERFGVDAMGVRLLVTARRVGSKLGAPSTGVEHL